MFFPRQELHFESTHPKATLENATGN